MGTKKHINDFWKKCKLVGKDKADIFSKNVEKSERKKMIEHPTEPTALWMRLLLLGWIFPLFIFHDYMQTKLDVFLESPGQAESHIKSRKKRDLKVMTLPTNTGYCMTLTLIRNRYQLRPTLIGSLGKSLLYSVAKKWILFWFT